MTPGKKPGIAFLVVLTIGAILALLLMMVFDAGVAAYLFFFYSVVLLIVCWRITLKQRLQFTQMNELSADLTASKQEFQAQTARLAAELRDLRAAVEQGRAISMPAAGVFAAAEASTAVPEMRAAAVIQPAQPREQQLSHAAPPPPVSPAAAQPSEERAPVFADIISPPSLASTLFGHLRWLLNFEERLGENWLAKMGAGILVLGIAFFLAWQLKEVGPVGKVTVGWLLGAVMLGAGVFFERSERYRILARAGVAGGWALLFFTAYAMNHIPASHVLDSVLADLALTFVVATGMVLHTLRYRSQAVTGLAFLFAFVTITFNRVPEVYSLTAAVVLAAGVAWVAVSREWFVLEACAIAATYVNHYLWLRPIIEPMGKHHKHFDAFLPSAAILVAYWAVFRFSYLWRKGGDHERVSALGALLNVGLLMFVLKYQSVHPEWAFWALLVLGSVELALGQLPAARARNMPHIVLTVVGACLLLAAIPFRYGAEYVSLLWLAEAEAFFLVGVLTREPVFRRVGLFAFVPLTVQLLSYEAARVYGARMDNGDVKGEFLPAVICALTALVLYVNVTWAPRRWAEQFGSMLEQIAIRDLSFAATVLALVSGWMAFHISGTAVFWMGLSCGLAWLAQRFDLRALRVQSLALAGFAFLRVLAVNLPLGDYRLYGHPWSARLLTTAATALLCYQAARWYLRKEDSEAGWLRPSIALSWIASTIVTLLLWYELNTAAVALGWGAFALLMLETGAWRESANLRLQAYVAGISCFLRLLFVNLNIVSPGTYQGLYAVIPLAALFFYFYQRLHERAERLSPWENRFRAAGTFAWLGTVTVVLLLRFQTPLDWVATAWAAATLALLALAWTLQERAFLHQAMLLSLGVLFRGVMHNLYERSYFTSPSKLLSTACVTAAVALLFAGLVLAFRLRRAAPEEPEHWLVRGLRLLDAHPEQILFFAPLLLLTAFLGVELRSGMVTVGWALEGVVVFLVALWIGERSYRLAGLALLLLCVAKILFLDIRQLQIRDRAISFMVLGALLVGVSILYTRNREKVRQFL